MDLSLPAVVSMGPPNHALSHLRTSAISNVYDMWSFWAFLFLMSHPGFSDCTPHDSESDWTFEYCREIRRTSNIVGSRQRTAPGHPLRRRNLPERYEPSIARMKTSDLRTAKGYALKENLRRCWHHRLERTARAHFRSWIRWAKRSALKPFAQVAAMIDSRLEDIVS